MKSPISRGSESRQADVSESASWQDTPAEKLSRAWGGGAEPELDSFVAGLPDATPADLAELIRVDLTRRWQRPDRERAESFLHRFPTVAADPELTLDIVYCEYLARERAGERPDLAEYEERFPALAASLAEQVRLHEAFETLEQEDPATDAGDAEQAAEQFSERWLPPASYELMEEIGSGGMGVVYKARHTGLDRFVALKMLREIDAGNPELLMRIRAEARVVATLDHPQIVQVYDYGEHAGLPFIAMELVPGGSLADRLNGVAWSPREAAELMVKLVVAVQFAHERRVIHRDLKPANVLIADGAGRDLNIKVTDFGLAKLCMDEATSNTRSFAFLGTPSYMAPEQAKGRTGELGPAVDIYSLGAILYELLTGEPPIRGASPLETLGLLLSSEPVSIHRRAPRVSRDLATICDKCLHREPHGRYGTAAELRADLEYFLQGRPIRARRAGGAERLWRWCRRNPSLAMALGSVTALLLTILCVSLWFSAQLSRELKASRSAQVAEQLANRTARERLWGAYLSEATALNNSRKVGQRFAALQAVDKAIALGKYLGDDVDRTLQLRNAVLSSSMLPDLQTLRVLDEWPLDSGESDISAAADCYVVSNSRGELFGYRLSNGQKLWRIEPVAGQARPILSRDGRLLAAVSRESTIVWRVDGKIPTEVWRAGPVDYFSFAPDGRYAACSDQQDGMRWLRVDDGSLVRSLGRGPARSRFAFHAATGRLAVCASSVQVISTADGQVEAELPLGKAREARIAWHPSGESLAIWEATERIQLWDIRSRTPRLSLAHRGVPAQLCFNEDGSILASHTLWDRRLLVWDFATAQRLLDVPDAISGACDAATQERIWFLTNLHGKQVLAELTPGKCRTLAQSIDAPLGYWHKASISPDNRVVAFSGFAGLELWDLMTMRRLLALPMGHCMAFFDRHGALLVGCNAGVFRLPCHRDAPSVPEPNHGEAAQSADAPIVITYGPPERLTGPIASWTLSLNISGELLVFQDDKGWASMCLTKGDAATRLQTRGDPRISAASNDNRHAAIANWESGGAAVWEVGHESPIAQLPIGRHGVLQFSPDGRLLAATPDGVTVWSASDWKLVSSLHAQGSTPSGLGMAFSPDSRVLAVGQNNGVLGLFDPATGKLWASLSSGDFRAASTLAFSPDQRWLVASSFDESSPAQVWDLAALRAELAKRRLDLPPDVLRPGAADAAPPVQLKVVLEDDQKLIGSPGAN